MIKDLEPRIPITRRVSAGLPATKDRNYPEKLDHFIISKDAKGDAFIKDVEAHKVVGSDAPRRINIRLMSDVLEDNLHIQHALWVGPRCMCSGDGEAALRQIDGDRKKFPVPCHSNAEVWPPRAPEDLLLLKKKVAELNNASKDPVFNARGNDARATLKMLEADVPSDPYRCVFKGMEKGGCKVTTRLIFRIDGLSGFARYQSHGSNTARELLTSFALIQRETGGVLRNIPLVLVVKWMRISQPDGKSANAPIVHVEAGNMDPQALAALAAAEVKARAGLETSIAQDRKMLQAAQAEIAGLATALEFGTHGDQPIDALTEEAEREEAPSGAFGGGGA